MSLTVGLLTSQFHAWQVKVEDVEKLAGVNAEPAVQQQRVHILLAETLPYEWDAAAAQELAALEATAGVKAAALDLPCVRCQQAQPLLQPEGMARQQLQ